MEQMLNGREDLKNILSYVDFIIFCNVINEFYELNHNIEKEGITFPISLGSRDLKPIKKYSL